MSKKENLEQEIKNLTRKINVLKLQKTLLENKLNNKNLTERQQAQRVSKLNSFE